MLSPVPNKQTNKQKMRNALKIFIVFKIRKKVYVFPKVFKGKGKEEKRRENSTAEKDRPKNPRHGVEIIDYETSS